MTRLPIALLVALCAVAWTTTAAADAAPGPEDCSVEDYETDERACEDCTTAEDGPPPCSEQVTAGYEYVCTDDSLDDGWIEVWCEPEEEGSRPFCGASVGGADASLGGAMVLAGLLALGIARRRGPRRRAPVAGDS